MTHSPRSAGRPGSGPGTRKSHHLIQDLLPERLLGAAGVCPAIEDLGHVPRNAELEVLDPLGL
jgi:hypothetical protein